MACIATTITIAHQECDALPVATAGTADTTLRAASVTADADRGRIALHQHACNACHVIPGVTGARVQVGPPLEGIGNRQMIAGTLPNTTEGMVRWLGERA